MSKCYKCNNESHITVIENERFTDYCGTCYFKLYSTTKITINYNYIVDDEIFFSNEIPIIVITNTEEDSMIYYIYVLFPDNLPKNILQKLNDENSIINEYFKWEIEAYNKNKYKRSLVCDYEVIDRSEIRSVISIFRKYEKIVFIKDYKIKHLTYDESINLYIHSEKFNNNSKIEL